MRFCKSVLRCHLTVCPGQAPMRIGARGCIAQARELFDFSDRTRHPRKRRSQQVFES